MFLFSLLGIILHFLKNDHLTHFRWRWYEQENHKSLLKTTCLVIFPCDRCFPWITHSRTQWEYRCGLYDEVKFGDHKGAVLYFPQIPILQTSNSEFKNTFLLININTGKIQMKFTKRKHQQQQQQQKIDNRKHCEKQISKELNYKDWFSINPSIAKSVCEVHFFFQRLTADIVNSVNLFLVKHLAFKNKLPANTFTLGIKELSGPAKYSTVNWRYGVLGGLLLLRMVELARKQKRTWRQSRKEGLDTSHKHPVFSARHFKLNVN